MLVCLFGQSAGADSSGIHSDARADREEIGPVSFRTDVEVVLAKAGCNLGTCHGNFNGKAGFRLSLRGQDPAFDFLSLTRDMFARRVNTMHPDESLILLKATAQVSHEGGRRFGPGSPEYDVLRRWISEGARDDDEGEPRLIRIEVTPKERILFEPNTEAQLEVRAVFSSGEERDVTSWAVYEPSVTYWDVTHDGLVRSSRPGEGIVVVRYLDRQAPVRLAFVPARPDYAWNGPPENNYVDRYVFAKLRDLRMNPSPLSTDSEFVRRAYLDVTGLLPTAEESRSFVRDTESDKRSRLIDELLERPAHADFWALKWSDLLRNEEKALDRKGVQAFHHWIRQSVAQNKPLDDFVRELVTARGSTYDHPPANFYRSLRDPISRAESTAQVFLGTRLQCAKCHNHPFDRWTQTDYYDWANLFARVDYKVMDNRRRDDLDKHEFVGEQVVWMARSGSVQNPQTGRPASSRFLDMSPLDPGPLSAGVVGDSNVAEDSNRPPGDVLSSMSDWLTSPDNPLFARVQANRIWYHLLGRGIVDPIDDFRPTNPASHPDLLDALARDFLASGFDVRHLIRVIMRSRTYQLSSAPHESNREDETNFSRALVQRLGAEPLLDAQCQVLGVMPEFNGYPEGMRAVQLPGVRAFRPRDRRAGGGDMFLRLFGKPERLLTCECERSDETTMSQAFQLISGDVINDFLTEEGNRLDRLVESDESPASMIETLYWSALSRPPDEDELPRCLAVLNSDRGLRRGLEDVAWALLNSKEFVFRK